MYIWTYRTMLICFAVHLGCMSMQLHASQHGHSHASSVAYTQDTIEQHAAQDTFHHAKKVKAFFDPVTMFGNIPFDATLLAHIYSRFLFFSDPHDDPAARVFLPGLESKVCTEGIAQYSFGPLPIFAGFAEIVEEFQRHHHVYIEVATVMEKRYRGTHILEFVAGFRLPWEATAENWRVAGYDFKMGNHCKQLLGPGAYRAATPRDRCVALDLRLQTRHHEPQPGMFTRFIGNIWNLFA